ncbi:MAG: hypothetical protein OER97_05790 [Gammaproteobacteria bacterium]|nr:hypothetical protein [Gammaproteobacteria bacterium]
MNKKTLSGLIGLVVGGAWLAYNLQYFDEQGFVAIGMPLLITAAGAIYLFLGIKGPGDP